MLIFRLGGKKESLILLSSSFTQQDDLKITIDLRRIDQGSIGDPNLNPLLSNI